jgi:hypothetical protein
VPTIDIHGAITSEWAAAGVTRVGTTGDPMLPRADVRWHGAVALPLRTCADLAPDGWACEEHGAKGMAGCQGPWMPAESMHAESGR